MKKATAEEIKIWNEEHKNDGYAADSVYRAWVTSWTDKRASEHGSYSVGKQEHQPIQADTEEELKQLIEEKIAKLEGALEDPNWEIEIERAYFSKYGDLDYRIVETIDSKSYREAAKEKEQDPDTELGKLWSELTPEEILNDFESNGFTDIALKDYGHGNHGLKAIDEKGRSLCIGMGSLTSDLFPEHDKYYSISHIRHELAKQQQHEKEQDYGLML